MSHPIKISDQAPKFPCWLFCPSLLCPPISETTGGWWHCLDELMFQRQNRGFQSTHWHPDQPTAPTTPPDNPPHPFDLIHAERPTPPAMDWLGEAQRPDDPEEALAAGACFGTCLPASLPTGQRATPTHPLYSIREGRRDALKRTVAELNNTSPECLEAVDGLRIMELEDTIDRLEAENQALGAERDRALKELKDIREDFTDDELSGARSIPDAVQRLRTRLTTLSTERDELNRINGKYKREMHEIERANATLSALVARKDEALRAADTHLVELNLSNCTEDDIRNEQSEMLQASKILHAALSLNESAIKAEGEKT